MNFRINGDSEDEEEKVQFHQDDDHNSERSSDEENISNIALLNQLMDCPVVC